MMIFISVILATCKTSLPIMVEKESSQAASLKLLDYNSYQFLLNSAIIFEKVENAAKTNKGKGIYPGISQDELEIHYFLTRPHSNWIRLAIKRLFGQKSEESSPQHSTTTTMAEYLELLEQRVYPAIIQIVVDRWILKNKIVPSENRLKQDNWLLQKSPLPSEYTFYALVYDHLDWLESAFNGYAHQHRENNYLQLYTAMNELILPKDFTMYADRIRTLNDNQVQSWYLENLRSTKIYYLILYIQNNFDKHHRPPPI